MEFAKILAAAKQWGYKGSDTDEVAVRSFVSNALKTRSGCVFNYKGGKPMPLAEALAKVEPDAGGGTAIACEEDEPGTVTRGAVTDTGHGRATTDAEYAAELDKKVKAGIDAALTARGLAVVSGRPAAVGDTGAPTGGEHKTEFRLRSGAEQIFDIRKRRGNCGFENFEHAMAYRDALVFDFGSHPRLGASRDQVSQAGGRLESRGLIGKDGRLTRAYATTPNAAGGALTATAYLTDMLKNVLVWGAARTLAKIVPMTEKEVIRPKHSGANMTVSYPTQNAATTVTTLNPYSNLTLTAKDAVITAQVSMQLISDTYGVDVAMDIGEDFKRSFDAQEDRAMFTGDGTASFAGMQGYTQLLIPGTSNGLTAGAATQVLHTDAQISAMMAKLPSYAWENSVFVCHYAAMSNIFNRLAAAIPGGLTWAEFNELGLGKRPSYRGRPIVLTEALNAQSTAVASGVINSSGSSGASNGYHQASASGTIDILFGDFNRSAMIGDRQGMSIEVDPSPYFLNYALALRAVLRHDVNVHDYGSATVPGPVVGLYQTT